MTTESASAGFPVVGIGASAGGLEAFEEFFRHVPADSGMAYVLVPHLDPDHASMLTEILQRTAAIPVIEALDQTAVEPNHVYVIPPNRDMAIFHGRLQLSVPIEPRGQRMPIDAFLRSLAEHQQENSIGIVLSGTGTDGTLGLRAILGAGGLTLVQDPATSKYDGMPTSAVQAGYAAHVVRVDKMPELLSTGARALANPIETPLPQKARNGMNHILMQLRAITGNDFSLYKKSTINRRIMRRMSQHNIEDTDVYARYLKQNPDEVRVLFRELLINVTSFFRDTEAFDVLQKEILPQLCKDKPDDYVFRVWVAGCATGEESYSIAMLLRELMDASNRNFRVQIYGTDLDDDAIDVARAGFYPPNIAQDVSPDRLRRFFVKEEAGYRIRKEIREMVVFAIQNVIKDPPFTKLDLLCCRNLLIYLEPELHKRLIPTFHFALKPDGILFLSPSESIGDHTELFSPVNRKSKFYRAKHAAAAFQAPASGPLPLPARSGGKVPEYRMNKTTGSSLADLTRRMLVKCFAPASVVTDLKGNALYIHGETGNYLRPAPGQPSLNVIEMAHEGLERELRTAIHSAAIEGVATLDRLVQVNNNGELATVGLSVRPFSGTDRGNLLLICFQPISGTTPKPKRKRQANTSEPARILELEHDLAYLKESFQATIEEQQASNEEIKSTNEELQSTNEELQSANEELETSKEELQSVNEEMTTVNTELQRKIEQLAGMQNDMKNLLDNINVGIIFLDRNLVIRSFTRKATRIYRLADSDVGRPLADIRPVAAAEDLLAAAQAVLDSLIPYEREMPIEGDTWMLVRIQPYRTLEDMIDGVVMAFTDITERIKAVATRDALILAQSIVDTLREPLVVLDGALKVITASASFYREFHVTPQDTLGRPIYDLGNRQWDIPALRSLLESILPEAKSFTGFVVEHDFPDIGHRKMILNANRTVGRIGEPQMILLSIEVNTS